MESHRWSEPEVYLELPASEPAAQLVRVKSRVSATGAAFTALAPPGLGPALTGLGCGAEPASSMVLSGLQRTSSSCHARSSRLSIRSGSGSSQHAAPGSRPLSQAAASNGSQDAAN